MLKNMRTRINSYANEPSRTLAEGPAGKII